MYQKCIKKIRHLLSFFSPFNFHSLPHTHFYQLEHGDDDDRTSWNFSSRISYSFCHTLRLLSPPRSCCRWRRRRKVLFFTSFFVVVIFFFSRFASIIFRAADCKRRSILFETLFYFFVFFFSSFHWFIGHRKKRTERNKNIRLITTHTISTSQQLFNIHF